MDTTALATFDVESFEKDGRTFYDSLIEIAKWRSKKDHMSDLNGIRIEIWHLISMLIEPQFNKKNDPMLFKVDSAEMSDAYRDRTRRWLKLDMRENKAPISAVAEAERSTKIATLLK